MLLHGAWIGSQLEKIGGSKRGASAKGEQEGGKPPGPIYGIQRVASLNIGYLVLPSAMLSEC